jgi:hypothetical protein
MIPDSDRQWTIQEKTVCRHDRLHENHENSHVDIRAHDFCYDTMAS